MELKIDLKKLYDMGIRHLYYGGTIDSCTYDVIGELGGVLLENGEIVKICEGEGAAFGWVSVMLKNGKKNCVLKKRILYFN